MRQDFLFMGSWLTCDGCHFLASLCCPLLPGSSPNGQAVMAHNERATNLVLNVHGEPPRWNTCHFLCVCECVCVCVCVGLYEKGLQKVSSVSHTVHTHTHTHTHTEVGDCTALISANYSAGLTSLSMYINIYFFTFNYTLCKACSIFRV